MMTTTEQIVPVSDFRIHQSEVLDKLMNGPVYLTQRSKPAAVLLSATLWDQLLNRLENQEDLIGSLKAELAIAQGQYEPETIDFDALEPEVAVDALPA